MAGLCGDDLPRIGYIDAVVFAGFRTCQHVFIEKRQPVEFYLDVATIAEGDTLLADFGFECELVPRQDGHLGDTRRPEAIPANEVGEPEDIAGQHTVVPTQGDLLSGVAGKHRELCLQFSGQRQLYPTAVDVTTATLPGEDTGDRFAFDDLYLEDIIVIKEQLGLFYPDVLSQGRL